MNSGLLPLSPIHNGDEASMLDAEPKDLYSKTQCPVWQLAAWPDSPSSDKILEDRDHGASHVLLVR